MTSGANIIQSLCTPQGDLRGEFFITSGHTDQWSNENEAVPIL